MGGGKKAVEKEEEKEKGRKGRREGKEEGRVGRTPRERACQSVSCRNDHVPILKPCSP